jgi:hypothetical protein
VDKDANCRAGNHIQYYLVGCDMMLSYFSKQIGVAYLGYMRPKVGAMHTYDKLCRRVSWVERQASKAMRGIVEDTPWVHSNIHYVACECLRCSEVLKFFWIFGQSFLINISIHCRQILQNVSI